MKDNIHHGDVTGDINVMGNSLTNGLFASKSDMIDKMAAMSHNAEKVCHQSSQQVIVKAFQELVQELFVTMDERDCTFDINFLWRSIDASDLQSRLQEPLVNESIDQYLDKLSQLLNPSRSGFAGDEMFFVNQDHIHFQGYSDAGQSILVDN